MTDLGLSLRQRAEWVAHLFKGIAYSDHGTLCKQLAPLIGTDGIVFDFGAHAGQMTKQFARIARDGRVYAIEPSLYALTILKPVVRLHRLANVEVVELAFADRAGRLTFRIPVKRKGNLGFGLAHLSVDGETGPAIEHDVEATTLDAFVEARAIKRCDFIKLDIEGGELPVLRGGRQTIRRFRPSLFIEIVAGTLAARANAAPHDIWSQFEGMNYRAYVTDGPRRLLRPTEGFVGDNDYLFVPEERAASLSAAGEALPASIA